MLHRGGRSENCGLLPALRRRASALLRLVATPQIFVRPPERTCPENHLTSDKRGAASHLWPARSPSARWRASGALPAPKPSPRSRLEETKYSVQFRRISPCIRGGRRLFVMEGSREQFFSPGLTPPAAWRPGGINPRASATPKGALRKILLLPPRKPVDLLHIKIRLQSRNLQPRRKGKSHVSITQ